MAERMRRIESWSTFRHILTSGQVAEKGNIACIDRSTGLLTNAATGNLNLLPIGYWSETKTGNGTLKISVELFAPIWVHVFTNASSSVDNGDIGNLCYLAGPGSVNMTDTNAPAGRVWSATTSEVSVQMASDIGIQGPQGEPG